MKQHHPQRPSLANKHDKKDKHNKERKKPQLVKTFFLAFWIAGTSTEFLMWITDGLFTWAVNTAVTKFATSVLASFVVLAIRIVFYITQPTRSKFMEKLSKFLKRLGAYIVSNKRTAGGILTSLGVTITTIFELIIGYATDFTKLITENYENMKWLDGLSVKGFNFAPLILAVIGIVFVVWNTFAAISRGLETPETYEAKEAELAAEKAEAERVKAEQAEEAKALAEAIYEIEQEEAEKEAQIAKEKATAEEKAEREKLEAEEKAKKEEYRKRVEKFKAELLAKRKAETENK